MGKKANRTDDPHTPEHEQAHWDLLWGVRRSIRYHRRRERWLDAVDRVCAFAVAVFGTSIFVSLLTGSVPALLTVVAAITATAGMLQLAFGLARRARLHSDLARDFVDLERAMVRAGEDLPEHELRELEARRLEIESREPPVLRVLDAMCHDELVTASGVDPKERAEPRWYQRWLANIVDVGAHRLSGQA